MKKNEIIELNGVEYTLELNRDSFLKIDQYCNIEKSMGIIQERPYNYVEEITDDVDPFADSLTDDKLIEMADTQEKALFKMVEVSFWIWMYPNHKLSITQVRDIVRPYLETEDLSKVEFISNKLGQYLQECVEIREKHNEEIKNLKAQANKK